MASTYYKHLYAAISQDRSIVKVGISGNPRERLGSMRCDAVRRFGEHGVGMHFIAISQPGVTGPVHAECQLKQRLRPYWIEGEYFRCCEELMEVIAEIESMDVSPFNSKVGKPKQRLHPRYRSITLPYESLIWPNRKKLI